MDENILASIKKMIGLTPDYNVYDADLLMHINSAIMTLSQLGVSGTIDGFIVTGVETWNDYICCSNHLSFIKQYIYLKVRLAFDPPQSSAVLTSIDNMIKELEWRINVSIDNEYKEIVTHE